MSSGYKWRPLQLAGTKPPTDAIIKAWMDHFECDRAEAIARMNQERKTTELWANDLYQVEVRRNPASESVHLNIRRIDGYPGRDWRHFQQIKNEIVGPECEAIEIYPAESRLVDTSNKYHLYACTDPKFRFPVGFEKRDVQFGDETDAGLRQRPPMKHAGKKGGVP